MEKFAFEYFESFDKLLLRVKSDHSPCWGRIHARLCLEM